jgi:hypothetical protein
MDSMDGVDIMDESILDTRLREDELWIEGGQKD